MYRNISNNLHKPHLHNTVLALKSVLQLFLDLLAVETVMIAIFLIHLREELDHLQTIGLRVHQRKDNRYECDAAIEQDDNIAYFFL